MLDANRNPLRVGDRVLLPCRVCAVDGDLVSVETLIGGERCPTLPANRFVKPVAIENLFPHGRIPAAPASSSGGSQK